jgi:phosphoglycolate phosphatase
VFAQALTAPAIQAVAFDLDGTLLDTASDIAVAANAALVQGGYAAIEPSIIREWIGGGLEPLMRCCLGYALRGGRLADAEEEVADLVATARRHYFAHLADHTQTFPFVLETLQRLTRAGVPLACVTNKPAALTEPLLVHTGLRGSFVSVVAGDTLAGHRKPDPHPLLHAANGMGVAATAVLMVGDSRYDVEAAHRAGMPAWVVPYGYRQGMTVDALGADRVIDHIGVVADSLLHE